MHVLIVDDLRTITVDEETSYGAVTYARSSEAAENLCKEPWRYDEIWLDHDLGNGDTSRLAINALVEWGMYLSGFADNQRLPLIRVITDNPAGRIYIRGALNPYYVVKEN